MEYIEGGDLKQKQEKGRFDESQVRRYFKDIVAGIDFLHGVAGVVHRDIKPENIMLDADDNAKLVDFGVCLVLDGGEDVIEDT